MTRVFIFLALIILIVNICKVSSASCYTSDDCSFVTENVKYVKCLEGECLCRFDRGFTGTATYDDPCTCSPNKHIYHENNDAYCLPSICPNKEREERLKKKVTTVYKNLIFPISYQIAIGNKSVSDLFAPNAVGRVDPVGTFDDYSSLIEYFYALAITPRSKVVNVNLKDLLAEGNKVYVRVDILFERTDTPSTPYYNLTQSGRFTFNENDLINTTQLIIHNLGQSSDVPEFSHSYVIASACKTLLVQPGNCNSTMDPQGYYKDVNDCIDFMTNKIPYGTFDRAASNTVSCRNIHTLLTVYDPLTHCKHAGKTGGGKCVDTPYSDYYKVDY